MVAVIGVSGTYGLLAIGMAFELVLVEIGLLAIDVVVAEIVVIGVLEIGVVGWRKCLSLASIISRVLMRSCGCWPTGQLSRTVNPS